MAIKRNDQETFDDFLSGVMAWTFIAVILVALGAAAGYWWNFKKHEISNDPEKWGQLGDYLGGIINPIVGLATVFLIILSVSIQRRELRSSLIEMKQANEAATRMSFEQSLFAWLENYHSQIREIDRGAFKGRQVLMHLYDQVLSPRVTAASPGFDHPETNSAGNEILIRLGVPGEDGIKALSTRQFKTTIAYQRLYQAHKSDLDAPFRTLYRLIRWIDESPLTNKEKWHYCTLVRSQLSWPELVFLYYNGLIKEGEKLAIYANRYALFDNILASDELIRFATQELTQCAPESRPHTRDGSAPWPYERKAFDSSEAKIALGLSADA